MYNDEPRYCDCCGEFHATQTVNVGRYEYACVCDECAREVDVYEAQFEQGWNAYDEDEERAGHLDGLMAKDEGY